MDFTYFLRSSFKESEFAGTKLDVYAGRYIEVYKDGKVIAAEDTRNLKAEKMLKIRSFRQQAFEEATSLAPLFEMILFVGGKVIEGGNVGPELNTILSKFQTKKQAVINCLSLEELDAVTWEN